MASARPAAAVVDASVVVVHSSHNQHSPRPVMASSSRKRARLHLRSRGRDDLLQQLVGEIRTQDKQFRCDLKRACKEQAELRAELEAERNYTSKLKRDREDIRDRLADVSKEFDACKHEHEKEMERLNTLLADTRRAMNVERTDRDAVVRQQTLAFAQRKVEKVLRSATITYQTVFKGSGLEFDQDAESSDEELAPPTVEPPVVPAAEMPTPCARSEMPPSNDPCALAVP